jgi:hypothetical protein
VALEWDQAASKRLRRRIIVLGVAFSILGFLALASASLVGEVHVALWLAIIAVGFLLGSALWAYYLAPIGNVRLR